LFGSPLENVHHKPFWGRVSFTIFVFFCQVLYIFDQVHEFKVDRIVPWKKPLGGCVFFVISRFGGVVSCCTSIGVRHFGFQNVSCHRRFERCMKRCPTICMHVGVFA
jgi:hypothetical protein